MQESTSTEKSGHGVSTTMRSLNRIVVQTNLSTKQDPMPKKKTGAKRTRSLAQVIEYLSSKNKAKFKPQYYQTK
jgi:hypothetical protein